MTRTKKITAAAVSIVILLALMFAGILLMRRGNTEYYVSLDINPSFELVMKKNGKVVACKGANEDAKMVLNGLQLVGKDMTDAVEEVMEALKENGYLKKDVQNQILVTVNDDSMSEAVLERVNKGIAVALEGQKLRLQVLERKVDFSKEQIEAAKNYKISAGKYAFITRIMEGDETITLEELASVNLQDLTQYARERGISMEEVLDRQWDAMDDAMDAIEDDADDINDVDDADDINDVDDADDINDVDDADDINDVDDADDINDVDDADDMDDKYDRDNDADDVNDGVDDMDDVYDVNDGMDDMDDVYDRDNDADDINDVDDADDINDVDDADDINDVDDADDVNDAIDDMDDVYDREDDADDVNDVDDDMDDVDDREDDADDINDADDADDVDDEEED